MHDYILGRGLARWVVGRSIQKPSGEEGTTCLDTLPTEPLFRFLSLFNGKLDFYYLFVRGGGFSFVLNSFFL